MPLPLYGFMEGDTIGLLIVADEHESVQSLAEKLRAAASLRVASRGEMEVVYQGIALDPAATLSQANFAPLQRFDLRRKHGLSETRNGG
jgi:Toluene-4-monooxygenase system protein B (TmoB)